VSLRVGIRLLLLVVIVAVGFFYIAFDVLQYRIGAQPFPVEVRLPRAGGLFAGGYVSYRGVEVGRVTSLQLQPDGVTAHLSIDPGTRIPLDTVVRVRDLSAVGEQYVDFLPRAAGGPYLHRGSVVGGPATPVPVAVGTLLANTSRFSNSLDDTDINALLHTLTLALQGVGPQLRTVLTASENLFADLQQVQPATSEDITGGNTLLDTGLSTNADVSSFSTELAQLTAQLKASNGDLASTLSNGSAATAQVQQLLASDTPSIDDLSTNLDTLSGITAADDPALQALLQVIPVFANDAASTENNGVIQGEFKVNDANTVCTYVDALPQPTAPQAQPDLTGTCPISAPDLLQRGAANAPEP
jgi:phospholipid/cholesterol/gamma-HCH transport system substrate-binding protein